MGARDTAGFLTPQNIPSHPTKHTAKSLVLSFFTAAGENKRAANRKRNPVLSDSWRSRNLVSTSRTALPGLRLAWVRTAAARAWQQELALGSSDAPTVVKESSGRGWSSLRCWRWNLFPVKYVPFSRVTRNDCSFWWEIRSET